MWVIFPIHACLTRISIPRTASGIICEHRPRTTKALCNRLVKTLPGGVQLRLPSRAQDNGAFKGWKGTVNLSILLKCGSVGPIPPSLRLGGLAAPRGATGAALRQRGQLLLISIHGCKQMRWCWCPHGKLEMPPRANMELKQIPQVLAHFLGICPFCKYSSSHSCPGLIAWQRSQCSCEKPHWLCSRATHKWAPRTGRGGEKRRVEEKTFCVMIISPP